MKRRLKIALLALLFALLAAPGNSGTPRALAQENAKSERGKGDSGAPRLLLGQVTDRGGHALPSAIVYLKNTKSLMIRTYIAAADGAYRFPALSPNVDYQVYAEHQGKRSSVKTLSAFDNRREAHIDLKIDK